MVTDAGLLAIGIEPVVVKRVVAIRRHAAETPAPQLLADIQPKIRAGTKQAQIIAMLQRPEGATVDEMVAATEWLAHTVRGSISGALKKRLGLPIAAEKVEGRGTVYRLFVAPS